MYTNRLLNKKKHIKQTYTHITNSPLPNGIKASSIVYWTVCKISVGVYSAMKFCDYYTHSIDTGNQLTILALIRVFSNQSDQPNVLRSARSCLRLLSN